MSVDLPSIHFPLPVLALPPLPESTVEPILSYNDSRVADNVSPDTWYMYSMLQNSDNYPNGFFSWEYSNVHMGDIVVPASGPPIDDFETKEEDYATGWRMLCFTCPSTPDGGEPDRNRTTGYPFCDERMLSKPPLVSFAKLSAPHLEVPISNVTDAESIMACTVQLNLNGTWNSTHAPWNMEYTGLSDLYTLSSQFFIANCTLRGPESEYPGRRYRYSRAFPQGVQDEQAQVPDEPDEPDEPINEHHGPFFVPTPTLFS